MATAIIYVPTLAKTKKPVHARGNTESLNITKGFDKHIMFQAEIETPTQNRHVGDLPNIEGNQGLGSRLRKANLLVYLSLIIMSL